MSSSSSTTKDAFATFVAASSVADTLSSFHAVRRACGVDESTRGLALFEQLKKALVPALPFRSAQLFSLLAARVAAHSAVRKTAVASEALVIAGAGPVGLRAAVEAVLCGFVSVDVVELRADFSRLNVLKTWKATLADLVALGHKILCPSQQTHGFAYVGTRDLQATLLKVALLLGVRFQFESRVVGVTRIDGAWHAVVVPTPPRSAAAQHDALAFATCRTDVSAMQRTSAVGFTEPAAGEGAVLDDEALARLRASFDVGVLRVNTLLVAEGEKSVLLSNLGFSRRVTRFASAVALVVNLRRDGAAAGERIGVASMSAADWNSGDASALVKLAERGIKCENVEHLVSSEARFFVLTVKKETLVERGVFLQDPENGSRIVISRDNINTDVLTQLACDVAATFGHGGDQFAAANPIQLFDFSSKGELVDKARAFGDLLVLPVGDALQNPFWPQGLGVNKGFHSALDGVAAALVRHDDVARAVETAVFLHSCRNYTAFFEKIVLPTADQWTCDATTRYAREHFLRMHMDAVEQGVESPLSDALLAHFGWKRQSASA
jgi:hypothetical protein